MWREQGFPQFEAQRKAEENKKAVAEKPAADDNVKLSLKVPASMYSGCETMVTVIIHNDGEKSVAAYGPVGGLKFTLTDGNGAEVHKTVLGESTWGQFQGNKFSYTQIKSGKELKMTFNLTSFYDVSLPGEYKIKAAWYGNDEEKKNGKDEIGAVHDIRTPEITFKVVAKDPEIQEGAFDAAAAVKEFIGQNDFGKSCDVLKDWKVLPLNHKVAILDDLTTHLMSTNELKLTT